jgi:hypothetical protein
MCHLLPWGPVTTPFSIWKTVLWQPPQMNLPEDVGETGAGGVVAREDVIVRGLEAGIREMVSGTVLLRLNVGGSIAFLDRTGMFVLTARRGEAHWGYQGEG